MTRLYLLLSALLSCVIGCNAELNRSRLTSRDTIAELRVVKGRVSLEQPGATARNPYARERLCEGVELQFKADAIGTVRDDSGALLLIAGTARVSVANGRYVLGEGRIFVDTQGGNALSLRSPRGVIEVSEGRSSVNVAADGALEVYVLRGAARLDSTRVRAGEALHVTADGKTTIARSIAWEDWTLGLATADPEAQPAPFGIGTIGARLPDDKGKPRFPLHISRLNVTVTINGDFANTEVDETFVNPEASTVEGLYTFRVPKQGILSRFGIDRDGTLVWGQIQERQQAREQYQKNVYSGSTEDPALLEWVQRGVYQARLYPIVGGGTRRLVTRYSEWLGRDGKAGERRLYVYPMAATGAEGTLPNIEEMTIRIDWSKSQAERIRAPFGAKLDGQMVLLKSHDFVPRADVAIELFDRGTKEVVGFRAKHLLRAEDIPMGTDRNALTLAAEQEPDYLLVSVPAHELRVANDGIDLAIVVDSSAATDVRALGVARHLAESLLSALGPTDRACLFTGDTALRPVLPESEHLQTIDEPRRHAYLSALALAPTGGGTDLGALLSKAAEQLDPKRRSAVVYVGDGRPSVGEMLALPLRERLARLPHSIRILAAAIGPEVNAPLLESLVRGGTLERVNNAYEAAQSALRILESATARSMQGGTVSIPGVERLLPRLIPPVAAGEPSLLVGRIATTPGRELTVDVDGVRHALPLRIVTLNDEGDLRRRWGEAQLAELRERHPGRLALVDLARRYGLVTEYTSLYVATKRESEQAEAQNEIQPNLLLDPDARRLRWKPWSVFGGLMFEKSEPSPPPAALASNENADNKEGGTGTRAKGEEGSMGNPTMKNAARRNAAPNNAPATATIGHMNEPVLADEAQASQKTPEWSATPPRVVQGSGRATARGRSAQKPGFAASPHDPMPGFMGSELPTASVPAPRAKAEPFGRENPTATKALLPSADHSEATTPREAASLSNDTSTSAAPKAPLAMVPHKASPCSPAADLPLTERRRLWSERLASTTGLAAYSMYTTAIAQCEARSFLERQILLYTIVDAISSVAERVTFYRSLLGRSETAAIVYRAILTRVTDAEQAKQLHLALGLREPEPALIARLLEGAKSPRERVVLLSDLVKKWPDDLELPLKLLDALEDSGDQKQANAYAQSLRRRRDATTHLRSLVGEFYLRAAKRTEGREREREEAEARRCFGEIVEFAPEDPVARRRLAELLSAHGWHEEAFRQYQTLKTLLPEDITIELSLAQAAFGMGKVEEALRWTEKAQASTSGDGQDDLSQAARAWARLFLAWSYQAAIAAKRTDEAERLLLRSHRVKSSDVAGAQTVILSWSHPEIHPSLWLKTAAGENPANNLSMLFIGEATVSEPVALEIRIDPEDAPKAARLQAEATVTLIAHEGTKEQSIVMKRLQFGSPDAPKSLRSLRVTAGALLEEAI